MPERRPALAPMGRPPRAGLANGRGSLTIEGMIGRDSKRDLLNYSTFERGVSAILLVGMVVVIAFATVSFLSALVPFFGEMGTPQDYTTFQGLFDRALAALIALELAHSVHQSVLGRHGLIQVRTVVIIGVLAVVRKFVLIDLEDTSGLLILGLSAAVLALGVVYALTHWIEFRERALKSAPKGDENSA